MKKNDVAQWVPHMLFPIQKQCYMKLCQKHLTRYKKKGVAFLQQKITIDETWMRDFEPELKSQSEVSKGKNSPHSNRGIIDYFA